MINFYQKLLYCLQLRFVITAVIAGVWSPQSFAQQNPDQAYQEYVQQMERLEKERLGGLRDYRAKKKAEEEAREKALREYRNRPARAGLSDEAFTQQIAEHRRREKERERLRKEYLEKQDTANDEVRLSFHDMGQLIITERPRVSQDKRELYQAEGGISNRGAAPPPSSRRASFRDRRGGAPDPRDERAVSDRDRARADFRGENNREPLPPPGRPPEPPPIDEDMERLPPPPYIEDEDEDRYMPEDMDEDVYLDEDEEYYD